MAIKVLVVDDLALVLEGISYLASQIDGIKVVGAVDSGEEAIKLAEKLKPDVVLLDLKMPDMDSIDITKTILKTNPKVKILIITAYNKDKIYPIRLLKIGAYGYINKEASKKELEAAIYQVYNRKRYITADIAKNLVLNGLKHDVDDNVFNRLSDTELQVAKMIAEGVDTSEIAKRAKLKMKTVLSYRYNIFEKLKLNGDVELLILAIRFGIISITGTGSKNANVESTDNTEEEGSVENK